MGLFVRSGVGFDRCPAGGRLNARCQKLLTKRIRDFPLSSLTLYPELLQWLFQLFLDTFTGLRVSEQFVTGGVPFVE
jgi:hypothetical protein